MAIFVIYFAQMVISAILGIMYGGVTGYFVTGLNVVGILIFALSIGYYVGNLKNVKEKKQNESELG